MIREVSNVEDANRLIEQGWSLFATHVLTFDRMGGRDHSKAVGRLKVRDSRIVYVLTKDGPDA